MSVSVISSSNTPGITVESLPSDSVTPVTLDKASNSSNTELPVHQGDVTQKVDGCRKRTLTPAVSDSASRVACSSNNQDVGIKLSKSSKPSSVTNEKARIRSMPNFTLALPRRDRPVTKLTVNLVNTYMEINRRYYENKALKEKFHTTLEGRFFELTQGTVQLGKLIGQGTFGVVHEGLYRPKESSSVVQIAFKVNKFVSSRKNIFFKESIRNEAYILKQLMNIDDQDLGAITHILDDGQLTENHYCMVQPLYSSNLYQIIEKSKFKGFSLRAVSKFASQLLNTLKILRLPEVNLVHADIKPENILLENPNQSKIRLIDFGSSTIPVAVSNPDLYICSRFYRPPEVIFKMPYDQSFDIWSVGCVLFEIHAGKPLFPAKDSDELVQMIIELLGPPPEKFIKSIPEWQKYFSPSDEDPQIYNYIVHEPSRSSSSRSSVNNIGMFFESKLSMDRTRNGDFLSSVTIYHTEEVYELFKHFMKSMIAWDPADRLSPQALLEHPFFDKIIEITSSATEALPQVSQSSLTALQSTAAAAASSSESSTEQ